MVCNRDRNECAPCFLTFRLFGETVAAVAAVAAAAVLCDHHKIKTYNNAFVFTSLLLLFLSVFTVYFALLYRQGEM